jgi:hypothetical protein
LPKTAPADSFAANADFVRSDIRRRSLSANDGIKMQHEWIGIPAKLCDDERYALGHQTSDKCHVAR